MCIIIYSLLFYLSAIILHRKGISLLVLSVATNVQFSTNNHSSHIPFINISFDMKCFQWENIFVFLQSVIMAEGIRWHFFNYYPVADTFVENVISLLYDTCAFYLEGTNFAFVKLRYKSQYRQSNINRHEISNELHISLK